MKKIVLAEDNSVFLLLIKLRLEKEGYKLFVAEDGKKAIELIETQNPDLILTNIMMDFVSGLEVISHVRNVLKKQTPIIVLSATSQEEMVIKSFDLGANYFIYKPLNPSKLITEIEKILIQH